MAHLFPLVFIGVVVSLIVFLYFEKRAIEAKRRHEKNGFKASEMTINENFERYDTQSNVTFYFSTMFVFTIFMSYFGFFKESLSLVDVFLYIFLTTFIGSLIIFLLKIKKSILIKVFAAFLYGAPLIASSAFGFIITYIIYIKLM
ncbi:MAG: hypothetical protein R3331_03475 [Sulfurospirillaceae bacterium]|nr:hypothetical protein [Sulfurospirillaceae bacterium]